MSVIARDGRTGFIKLFTKGADTAMRDRVKNEGLWEQTAEQLRGFSEQGW